ncbi:hypothetical protein GE061_009525 [Apolygus lucorum]|uniref:Uncharacterized protein n=1 Tax=Apolygus lucorum TaxID=248454 RepID=A0A8S9Y0G6_APOLU|nr:hypothetical protein GE061_009525 [Apolygus lucorum]
MPAGVTWPQYLRVVAVAMLSMMAGAQTVHLVYKPLDDLDELVKQEIEKRKAIIMAPRKQPISREEMLRRKRLKERERYAKIKNDPALLKLRQESLAENYVKRKATLCMPTYTL